MITRQPAISCPACPLTLDFQDYAGKEKIAGIQSMVTDTADLAMDEWNRVLDTDLKGVWLCSSASTYVIGQSISVDGGYTII